MAGEMKLGAWPLKAVLLMLWAEAFLVVGAIALSEKQCGFGAICLLLAIAYGIVSFKVANKPVN